MNNRENLTEQEQLQELWQESQERRIAEGRPHTATLEEYMTMTAQEASDYASGKLVFSHSEEK